jgi:hypothetical protein
VSNAPDHSFTVDRPDTGAVVDSPEPPPLLNLSDDELRVYEYLCTQLRGAGIEHLTAGMPIAIIVRTYADWIKARAKCEELGWTQESKNGWHSPTPWADDEKRLKMELGQWLPKACLTIPSLVRVRKESGVQSGQDDLFADLVQHATASPNRGLPN